MENSELIKVILTSSLIASILSAIVSTLVSIKLKNLDYKNEYYKKILEKRLTAYNFLEAQIAVLKSSVLDEDAKPYHLIFAYEKDKFYEFQQNLFSALSYSMWINSKTVNQMEKLNELFYRISRKVEGGENLIKVGKDNYNNIANHRNSLEYLVRDDLLKLHNLKSLGKSASIKGITRNIEFEK